MAEHERYAEGTPSWVDLQTTDQAAAKEFYGALFGWTFEDLAVDDGNGVFYTMAKVRDREVAAIAPLGDQAAAGVPPHWNSYVTVDDVDASTAKVAPAGGTVLAPPFDVMDAGRMAVVQDPTGAVLILWTAKNSIGARIVNEPNTFCWSELITADMPAAVAFYEKVLGWGAEANGDPPYTEFKLAGQSIAGGMNPPMPGIPPMWGIYFATDDADAAAAKATSLGGSIAAGPMDIEPGRLVVIVDPQGAVFNVLKLNNA